jgi:hypothetical protein
MIIITLIPASCAVAFPLPVGGQRGAKARDGRFSPEIVLSPARYFIKVVEFSSNGGTWK